MSRHKQGNKFDERFQRCRDRALAVWSCVSVLRPDLSPKEKEALAKKVLKLAARKGRLAITPAAEEEIVLSNMQCIELPVAAVLGAAQQGNQLVLRGGIMDDIEMREAQLVLATLERQWDDDRNRSFALMEQLNKAEKRLLALFSGEWEARGGERRMINLAYSSSASG